MQNDKELIVVLLCFRSHFNRWINLNPTIFSFLFLLLPLSLSLAENNLENTKKRPFGVTSEASVSGFGVVTCEACESGFDRGYVTCVTDETSESSLGCALVI
ncbi:hypothetical protein MtrunA17_Chr4g0019261 [Medicago truncatula]|nr:hypothetical protein MtrunA17_Chr4g0019261 [Medicago truncatula]